MASDPQNPHPRMEVEVLRRRNPTCAVRRAVVIALREPALSRQARAEACLGAQTRLGRKVIFGTESIEQTRTGACTWKKADAISF